MCEFYNLDEVGIEYISPTKNDREPRYYELKSGDVIVLDFEVMLNLFVTGAYNKANLKFLEKERIYKNRLFARLKLPKWKIFTRDAYTFMIL